MKYHFSNFCAKVRVYSAVSAKRDNRFFFKVMF